MTYDEAKALLQSNIDEDGGLDSGDTGEYLYWRRGQMVDLDGQFTIQLLEAIAVYVKGTPRK